MHKRRADAPDTLPPPPDALANLVTDAGEPDLGPAPSEVAVSPGLPSAGRDLLHGDLRGTVFWLALPVLGEQLLNAMVAWNDTFLAGRIDAVSTAAVGFGAYVSWLVGMLMSLVAIGSTAIVSRMIGARQPDEANRACNQSTSLAVLCGLVAAAAAWYSAPTLVYGLGLSPAAAPVAIDYIRIDALGYLPEAITLVGAACLRGAGNTRTPMYVVGAINVVNCIVSWVLTFGAGPVTGIGVNGVAWGTVTARYVGGALMLAVLLRGSGPLRLQAAMLPPAWAWARRIMRIGLPASIDGGLMWVGHFAFMRVLTTAPYDEGRDVLYAAHIVGIRIESLSYLPAFAWSVAASTLMGQNLGAGLPDRALACAREARRQAILVLVFAGACFFFGAPSLYRFMSNDPRVVEAGVPALRSLAFIQPFVATLIVTLGALRGAGDTVFPMLFTVCGIMLIRVPVAYAGAVWLRGGLIGAWCGMYCDLIVRSLLFTWRLRGGAWRKIKV